MTRKRLPEPTLDKHLDIYASDWKWIEARFGKDSASRFGAAKFCREVIHKKVKELRAKEEAALDGGQGAKPPETTKSEIVIRSEDVI